jgi:ferric-dicitrate binding protein FerR (iron transport regulator)
VTVSPDSRLDELFVRYWDNVLTPAEIDELAQRLATDSAARDQFQFLCLLAVAGADLPAGGPLTELPADAKCADTAKRGWSRRRVLGVLAAGVGGVALGRWAWDALPSNLVKVVAVQGRVTVRTADGRTVAAEGRVPTGATVSTHGFGALAVLSYPDDSTVTLLGDSAITVEQGGRLLRLHQGTANADLRPNPDGESRLTLLTALVTLARVSDTTITIGQGTRSTEVEVHQGKVSVATATGEPLAVVRGGELLTVAANGTHRQEPTPPPRSDFAWNLAVPLPEGWQVGRRDVTPSGPVVRPVAWPDPYYDGKTMFQIRSDHQWTRGLFSLVPDSVISVRYRAKERSLRGQVCFCVRTSHSHSSDTGMLEYNDGFEATAPDAWKWLHVRAGDMLANKHTPKFGSPWVGFLVIFNTFQTDVGLEVAEFRVSPPNKPPV